ncbi:MAG TPA: hypothetical protein V6C63_12810 [Allocoleopsis sp.]
MLILQALPFGWQDSSRTAVLTTHPYRIADMTQQLTSQTILDLLADQPKLVEEILNEMEEETRERLREQLKKKDEGDS